MDMVVLEVEKRIKEKFWDTVEIDFKDEKWDGKHFFLSMISGKFEWLSRVARSQSVYEVLNDLMQTGSIHALRMNLKTPQELI